MLENILESSDGLRTWLQNLLMSWHLPEWTFNTIDFSLRVLAMWALSYLAYFITKKVLLFYTIKLVQKTKTKYDDYLITRKVFHRFSQLAPGLVIYLFNDEFFGLYPSTQNLLHQLSVVYMVFVLFWTIQASSQCWKIFTMPNPMRWSA